MFSHIVAHSWITTYRESHAIIQNLVKTLEYKPPSWLVNAVWIYLDMEV